MFADCLTFFVLLLPKLIFSAAFKWIDPPKLEILVLCGPSRNMAPVGDEIRRLSPALERREREIKSASEVKPVEPIKKQSSRSTFNF